MKKILIFFCLFLIIFVVNIFAVDNSIQEITIKGDLTLQLSSQKPKLNIDFNRDSVLQNISNIESIIVDIPQGSAELDDVLPALPSIIFSKNPINPFLINISQEPVLNFTLTNSPNFKAKKWKIDVTDLKGAIFATIKNNDSLYLKLKQKIKSIFNSNLLVLPSNIQWSGKNKNNEMLIPGKWYSYNLLVSDEFGYDYTIKGNNFKLKGVFYSKGSRLKIISLSLSDIFDFDQNSDTLNIKQDGEYLLREAADILKYYYSNNMNIVIYDSIEKIAIERAKKIFNLIFPTKNIMADGKMLPNVNESMAKANIRFIPSYISDYRIEIEIVIK